MRGKLGLASLALLTGAAVFVWTFAPFSVPPNEELADENTAVTGDGNSEPERSLADGFKISSTTAVAVAEVESAQREMEASPAATAKTWFEGDAKISDEKKQELDAATPAGSIEQRYVEFDPASALAALVDAETLKTAIPGQRLIVPAEDNLTVQTFGDGSTDIRVEEVAVTLSIDGSSAPMIEVLGTQINGEAERNASFVFLADGGSYTFHGKLEGEEATNTTVQAAGEGTYRVDEIDVAALNLPEEGGDEIHAGDELDGGVAAVPPPSVERANGGLYSIDLLVGYTSGTGSNILAEIASQVTQLNQALQRSQVNARMALVDMKSVGGSQSSSMQADLAAVANGSNEYLGLRERREQIGADLVALVVPNATGGACGVAYLPSPQGSPRYAYSVTAKQCFPNLTFLHEVGHNLGASHNPEVLTGAPYPFSYSTGHAVPGVARDIMAYACSSRPCQRLAQFSNPNLAFMGYPGVASGIAGRSDVARSFNQMAPIIANYGSRTPTHARFLTFWNANGGAAGKYGAPTANAVDHGYSVLTQEFAYGTMYYNSWLGVTAVNGAIRDLYKALDPVKRLGPWGALGYPVGGERPAGSGVLQKFENGAIYWSAKTGAVLVDPQFAPQWNTSGGVSGRYGAPVANPVSHGYTVVTQEFAYGTMYYNSWLGVTAVNGAIRDLYKALDPVKRLGPWGALGYPVGGETPISGGVVQKFENGEITWTPQRGAVATMVDPRFTASWNANGGVAGRYGRPLANAVGHGYSVVTQEFERGTMYSNSWLGVRGVTGHIRDLYKSSDTAMKLGPWGALGYPVGGETAVAGGVVQRFEYGEISVTSGQGDMVSLVHPKLAATWNANGGSAGRYGRPLANAVDHGYSVVTQEFERGTMYSNSWLGVTSVSGAIRDLYKSSDTKMGLGPWGPLGYPVGGETSTPGGVLQKFEKGSIVWTAAGGARLQANSVGAVAEQLRMPGQDPQAEAARAPETSTPEPPVPVEAPATSGATS